MTKKQLMNRRKFKEELENNLIVKQLKTGISFKVVGFSGVYNDSMNKI